MEGSSSSSSGSSGPMLDRQARNEDQNSSRQEPAAHNNPTPVTTTRLPRGLASGGGTLVTIGDQAQECPHNVAHGPDLAGLTFRDVDPHPLLEDEKDLQSTDRVDSEILERALDRDPVAGDAPGF